MKKYLVVFLCFLLCACSSNNQTQDETIIEEYIEPVNDVEVFKYLNTETYDLLYKANNNSDVETYKLQCLGKELLDYKLTDYYGNEVNLNDYKDSKLIIEVAANWCSHCMEQSKKHNKELLKAYNDITIIQYFNEGTIDQIDNFYKEVGESIPKDIIVIPENKEFSNLLLSEYNPQFYPSFLIFNNGILTWIDISSLSKDDLQMAYDVAFNNALDINDLVDNMGESVFKHCRTVNDVKDDLSKENLQKLNDLDNDHYTTKQTLSIMGKPFNYSDQLENDSKFESEVNFIDYKDKDVVIIYISEYDKDKLQIINDYYDARTDISVIVLSTTDKDMDLLASKSNAPVASIMNQIPKALNDVKFNNEPSCIFVQKGIITGAYSNILDIKSLNEATDLFIGDNSIALTSNN